MLELRYMDHYFLSDNYLLKGAKLGDVDSIHIVCEFREFAPGDTIVSMNDKSQDLMIVIEGRVRVETASGDTIDELRAGAMIGEISFLDGQRRTANVTSIGKTKIAIIPADRLRQIMNDNPALGSLIYKNAAVALCKRLRDANQQIEALLVPR
jgi:CRP/FNR family cyclic AMP-dependent transcriptional regulator